MPFKRPAPEQLPDYKPNFEYVQTALKKGSVQFSVFSDRRPFIPE